MCFVFGAILVVTFDCGGLLIIVVYLCELVVCFVCFAALIVLIVFITCVSCGWSVWL